MGRPAGFQEAAMTGGQLFQAHEFSSSLAGSRKAANRCQASAGRGSKARKVITG